MPAAPTMLSLPLAAASGPQCAPVARAPSRPLNNASFRIPTRHMHRADGCISGWLCCGQALPATWGGTGEHGKKKGRRCQLHTGDYMVGGLRAPSELGIRARTGMRRAGKAQ